MIKVNQDNLQETKQFVIDNLKRSGFTYGNLLETGSTSYILKEDGNIIAMTNSLNGKYVTYLFPSNTSEVVVRKVIEFMQDKPHVGGTVTGDYYHIFKDYYELPTNAINEVASLQATTSDYQSVYAEYITVEDIDEYKQALDTIVEFRPRANDDVKDMFERTKVVAVKQGGKIVSSVCLSAISDKTAVVTGVFTVKEYEGNGYAKDCMNRILADYAEGRTLLIFFTNPKAKDLYLKLGFEVDDKLIMYNEKLQNT